jgi:F0F1-type ATP synthase membrane subunit c/vacuolar-type H+-ATPase subunit K
LTAAAVESIARQPQAARDIVQAFQLPLFLLEGVAVIALGVCFVVIFMT